MITILTPTYNRAYCLSDLYRSLKEQTNYDFEWLIIDDGSTDETEDLVCKWIMEEKNFKITYKKVKNGGKHRAINYGVAFANGEYTYIVDSDDTICEEAIILIEQWVDEIRGLNNFAGVSGTRGDKISHKIIGQFPLDREFVDATNIQRKKYKLLGDKAEIYRTDLLRMYKFPEFENENYIGESSVWDEIAHDGYKIRWHKDVICYCEYLQDGLTMNNYEVIKQNPNGFAYVKRLIFHYYPLLYKWGALCSYIDFGRSIGLPNSKIRKNMNINRLQMNIGLVMYFFWKKIHNS